MPSDKNNVVQNVGNLCARSTALEDIFTVNELSHSIVFSVSLHW